MQNEWFRKKKNDISYDDVRYIAAPRSFDWSHYKNKFLRRFYILILTKTLILQMQCSKMRKILSAGWQ